MSFFKELWENEWLITALIGWFAAQLLKIPFTLVTEKRFMVSRFFDSGGMPSSHSAFTSALAAGVGLTEGFDSVSFALAFVLAFVVMYDAAGVRRSAGEHARILNRLTEHLRLTENGKEFDRLKTLLGHTPLEVICGAVLGIAIALIRHL